LGGGIAALLAMPAPMQATALFQEPRNVIVDYS